MNSYVIILKFDNNFELPLFVKECQTNMDALSASTHFCNKEGYFPSEIKAIRLLKEKEIVRIDRNGNLIKG